MPSIPNRQPFAIDSDSNDGKRRENPSFLQGSNDAKRVRLTPQPDRNQRESSDASSVSTGDASDESNSDHDEPQPAAPLTTQTTPIQDGAVADVAGRVDGTIRSAGVDTYRTGAIVRIKLTNFVTYTSVELRPRPRLNMVIGPNGTGKSTLVCAICLGLGEGPQHLGRAKDASEYIKHGCQEAIIEIELAGPPGKRNVVITRVIKREGNKSTYTTNGEPSTQKKVREMAKKLSIQIDNLCQFLPQDKVCEFAGLTPVDLLQSTQRAAAPAQVTKWYEHLKTLRNEQKKVQAEERQARESLQNLERRQENQREDVERIRERVAVKQRLDCLEQLRPVPKMRELKAQHREVRGRDAVLTREKRELEAEVGPTLKAINTRREYYLKLDKVVKQKRANLTALNRTGRDYPNDISATADKIKDLGAMIEAEKKTGTAHIADLKKVKQTVNRIERQMEEGAPEFDSAAYNEKIRERNRQIQDIKDKATDVHSRKGAIAKEHQKRRADYLESQRRLDGLQHQDGQQEEKLRQLSRDSYEAWRWLKEEKNQALFEKQVFGPPVVVCSVKDPKYAMAIEGLMQRNDFCAFTAQTRNDFRKLQKFLCEEMKFYDITIKTCSMPLSDFRPPISDVELRQLQFDGWASDYIAGPEPVLAMLCSENRFNTTPIMLRDITDREYQHLENSRISAWISKKQHYQVIRRREYGPSATSTRVRSLRPATWWTDKPVDDDIKLQLQNEINERKMKMDEIQEQINEEAQTLTRLEGEHKEASEEKRRLENEKAGKQSALTAFRALPTRLNQQNERLNELVEVIDNIREKAESLRKEQDLAVLQKAAVVLKYADYVKDLQRTIEDLVQTEIKLVEARSDCQGLEERSSEVKRILAAKDDEIAVVKQQILTFGREIENLRQKIRGITVTSGNSEELKEIARSIAHHTVEQLEAEIDSAKATLDLTYAGHGTKLIEEFEKRQVQIDKIRERVQKHETDLVEFDHAIKEIRDQWEPKLESLVQKISNSFSDFFARIGCAGQVGIDKGEETPDEDGRVGDTSNFDQWSIRIQVKFREHESLAVLNSYRQSGGERAVSTIFYLMALQSLSPSPFRVVDEINQGMDPRNERMVHERMVEIACGQAESEDSGGQYFLITPKLLNGLHYQRGMTVLCIYSGEYMPQEYAKLDFKQCVSRMRDMKAEKRKRLMGERGEVEVGA